MLDEMELYEIRPLIERSWLKSRESWEQTRVVCGYLHKAWFKGEPKMKFPWDEKSPDGQKVTINEAKALTALMAEEEKKFKTR